MLKCESCGKIIKNKEDVNALAFLGVQPKYFCNNCYSSKERGLTRHFFYMPYQPINSKLYSLRLWVSSVLFLICLLIIVFLKKGDDRVFFILFLIIWAVFLAWFLILYFIVKRKLAELH